MAWYTVAKAPSPRTQSTRRHAFPVTKKMMKRHTREEFHSGRRRTHADGLSRADGGKVAGPGDVMRVGAEGRSQCRQHVGDQLVVPGV